MCLNYADKTTNLQSEVIGKFITVEAGVTLNSPKCEMYDKISKECQDCVFVTSGRSLIDLQYYKEIEESISVIKQQDGTNKLIAIFKYTNPIQETFSLKNSNYKEVRASAENVAKRLMRKGKN